MSDSQQLDQRDAHPPAGPPAPRAAVPDWRVLDRILQALLDGYGDAQPSTHGYLYGR